MQIIVTVWKQEEEKAEVQEDGYLSILQQKSPCQTFRQDLNTFKAQGERLCPSAQSCIMSLLTQKSIYRMIHLCQLKVCCFCLHAMSCICIFRVFLLKRNIKILFFNSQHHAQCPASPHSEVSANDCFRQTLNCPQR